MASKILATRSVGGLSPVPFASLFTNSLIWLYYGIMKNDPVIYGPNIIGIATGVGCIIAYESKATVGNLPTYAIFLLVCIAATVLLYLEESENLGLAGCGLSVITTAAPLAALPTIIKERSTAALPLNPILMALFCCISWALYGFLIAKDILVNHKTTFPQLFALSLFTLFICSLCTQIYGPNVCGICFCLLQLLLFVIYRLPSKTLPL